MISWGKETVGQSMEKRGKGNKEWKILNVKVVNDFEFWSYVSYAQHILVIFLCPSTDYKYAI